MKNLNKNKIISLLMVCLFTICLISPSVSATRYNDYYWTGSYVSADDTGISYHYLKNGTAVTRWACDIPTVTASIDNKLVYVLNNQNILTALNKTNGKDIWSLDLFDSYSKSQFVTKKYLLLSSSQNAALINLATTQLIWTKSYNIPNVVFYGAINAKNGSYYLMLKSAIKTRFYKLKV